MKYNPPQSIDIVDEDFVQPSRLHEHGLRTADYVHYTGSSMYPTFHDPEFLLMEKPSFDDFRIGDVIIFKSPCIETLVIHRIIRKREDKFITKGDNNSYFDPFPVSGESIYGRAIGILTKNGNRPIMNGRLGLIQARFQRLRSFIKHFIVKPLIWNALTVHSRDVVTQCIFIKPEFVVFRQPGKPIQIRLIWKNRTIGYYDVKGRRIIVRRLYRIGINRSYIEKNIQNILQSPEFTDSFYTSDGFSLE